LPNHYSRQWVYVKSLLITAEKALYLNHYRLPRLWCKDQYLVPAATHPFAINPDPKGIPHAPLNHDSTVCQQEIAIYRYFLHLQFPDTGDY